MKRVIVFAIVFFLGAVAGFLLLYGSSQVLAGHSKLNPDINHDGLVNVSDLGILLVNWNRPVVRFTGSSFIPASITVKSNDSVVFLNDSLNDMWPASDPHPIHTTLSSFDPLHPVPSGQVFIYKFTQAGTWNYHDHIVPGITGSVVVQ